MCWCAGFTTPLEGVTIYTQPDLPEWEALRRFLDQRGVLYDVTFEQPEGCPERTGPVGRPVVVIGKHTVVGFDESALLRLLP